MQGHQPKPLAPEDAAKAVKNPPASGTAITSSDRKAVDPDIDPQFVPKATLDELEAQQRMKLYGTAMEQLEPVVDYQAYLKGEGISEDDAATIVDDLITQGYYEERVTVTKRSTVLFRTRKQNDTLRLQRAIEVQRPLFRDAMDELVVRYNMAASLAAFKDMDFKFPEEDDTSDVEENLFDVRLNYVAKMPGALFSALSMKLAKFDRKIMTVMREGVAENF